MGSATCLKRVKRLIFCGDVPIILRGGILPKQWWVEPKLASEPDNPALGLQAQTDVTWLGYTACYSMAESRFGARASYTSHGDDLLMTNVT